MPHSLLWGVSLSIKSMTEITGNFNWNKPEVHTSFVQGADAQAIYNSLQGNVKSAVSYDAKSQTLIGSNVFVAARIDSILRPLGIRVANPRDLGRPEVMGMVRGKHYTDAPTLVLRSTDDSYARNLPLIKQLTEQIEQANGRVQLPVMVTGFDVKVIKDDKGYGIALVPRDDFKAVNDKRLDGSNNGKRFSGVDEFGLPNFDSDGNRTWYARSQGLSGFYLDGDLIADSDNGNLADSDGDGRVVVVSDSVSQKNLEGKLAK